MRKFASLTIASALLAGCLTGCSGYDKKFIGYWEASEMIVNGNSIKDIAGVPIGAMMRFELKKDGTADWASPLSAVGDPSKSGVRAVWKSTDTDSAELTISVPEQDDSVINLEYADGRVVIESNGVETYLEKVDQFSEVDEKLLNDMLMKGFGSMLGE